MRKQYWFSYWLGAVRHQAITWACVDIDLGRHFSSAGPNKLSGHYEIVWYISAIRVRNLMYIWFSKLHKGRGWSLICIDEPLWHPERKIQTAKFPIIYYDAIYFAEWHGSFWKFSLVGHTPSKYLCKHFLPDIQLLAACMTVEDWICEI